MAQKSFRLNYAIIYFYAPNLDNKNEIDLFCYIFAVLCLISVIYAAPGVTPYPKKKCGGDCLDADFDPVCGGPAGTTDKHDMKSFGSRCVLELQNCERGTGI